MPELFNNPLCNGAESAIIHTTIIKVTNACKRFKVKLKEEKKQSRFILVSRRQLLTTDPSVVVREK